MYKQNSYHLRCNIYRLLLELKRMVNCSRRVTEKLSATFPHGWRFVLRVCRYGEKRLIVSWWNLKVNVNVNHRLK